MPGFFKSFTARCSRAADLFWTPDSQRIYLLYESVHVKPIGFLDDEERAREVPDFVNRRVKPGEIVLRAGVIDELQLESALGQQSKWGGRLGVVLVRMGFVTEPELVNAVASQLNLPVATLDKKKTSRQILDLIPYEYADDHTCLPLFLKNEEGRDTL